MINIVVVDDEPKILRGIVRLIEFEFSHCAQVQGFQSVRSLLDDFPDIDILITDICIPDIDGLELATMVRERSLRTKIIIISGYEKFEYARTAIRLQVTEYLLKPINRRQLIQLLENLIEDIQQNKKSEEPKPESRQPAPSPISVEPFSMCSFSSELPPDEATTAGIEQKITRAKEYMQEHYNFDLSLEEVAEEVGLNPSYFSSMFKKHTDCGFVDFLVSLRLEQAKFLLVSTEMTIAEIAKEIGYNGYRYFARIFKRSIGVTPSEYRILTQQANFHQDKR